MTTRRQFLKLFAAAPLAAGIVPFFKIERAPKQFPWPRSSNVHIPIDPFGPVPTKPEGGKIVEFVLGFRISKEAIEDDKYSELRQLPNRLRQLSEETLMRTGYESHDEKFEEYEDFDSGDHILRLAGHCKPLPGVRAWLRRTFNRVVNISGN